MELTIQDLRALIGSDAKSKEADEIVHGTAIVAADRGHVWVGRVKTDKDWCHITNAATVRRWGTTKGLGQLAAEGPLKDTVLDDEYADVLVPMRAVIAIRGCAWRR